jgi:hypothetical protein
VSERPVVPERAPRQPVWFRVVLIAATLWAFVGYLLVPWAVHRWVPPAVAGALDARLDIGDVHFDPFLMRLRLFDVALTGPGSGDFEGHEVLRVDRLQADLSAATLLETVPVLSVRIVGPALHLERDPAGALNALALLPPADDAAPAEDGGGALPGLEVSLSIEGGRVTLLDRSRPTPFETRLTDLDLAVADLRLPSGPEADWSVALAVEGAGLEADGTLTATPTAAARLGITDFPLALADRWLADTTPIRDLAGRVDVSVDARLDADGSASLADARIELSALDVRTVAPLPAGLRLDALVVEGVSGPLTPVDLAVARVAVRAPRLDARWNGTGDVEPANPAPQDDPGVTEPDPAPAAGSDAPDAGPSVRIEAIEVRDLAARVTDATLPDPATLGVDRGRLDAGPLVWPPAAPVPVDVGLRIAGSGEASATGEADLGAPGADLRVDLEGLDLAGLAPWVDAWSRLGLRSGRLGLGLDLTAAASVRVTGGLALDDLALTDPDGVDLIAWRSLAIDGIDVDTAAPAARIATITLTGPRGRFARLADGSTNLDGIGPRAGVAPAPADASADDGADAAGPAWQWAVDRLELAGGQLDFVDETLVIPFGTTIEALEGTARDLSSTDGRRAGVRLDGRVPPNGSARIEATLPPLAPLDDTEIAVSFARVPMPRLTPYVGTFAGYRVASGRLDLDLDYRITDAQLVAENRVVLDSLRLGPRIDSPDALDLPLELGLALLRDGDDRIVLEVPVNGSLDDPEFDLAPVILRAVGNIFTNLVAAPFKLLGSLIPDGSPDIDRVAFAIGEATIPEDQLDRFVDLEAALGQRPALQLVLTPTHAGGADRDALRIAELTRRLEATGEDEEAALRSLFAEDYGEEALEALEGQYAEAEGAAASLERELRGRLLADVTLTDGTLADLARQRAETVSTQLTDAGLAAERIVIEDEIAVVEADGDRLTMSFDLAPGDLAATAAE